ncbi:MAG: hypothetical protein ACRDQ2_13455 [Gaiellales bacterium]
MTVYAIVDDSLSPTSPLGDTIETFLRREDAERFIRRLAATIPSSRATCGSRSASWTLVRRLETSDTDRAARKFPRPIASYLL